MLKKEAVLISELEDDVSMEVTKDEPSSMSYH